MSDATDAKVIKYQFEVPIDRSAADAWTSLVNEIDAWWAPDFRALGVDSTMTLHADAGGQVLERSADGCSLEWYRVQMAVPGQSLHLVGYLAPDWGGPTISMLKLAVEDRDNSCALIVSDALLGSVTDASANSAEDGWRILFGEGFKTFAEQTSD